VRSCHLASGPRSLKRYSEAHLSTCQPKVAAGPQSLKRYSREAGIPLKTNGISAFSCRKKSLQISEKGKLIRIFLLLPAPLTRESNDIFILFVRESQDVNVAAIRQIVLDPPQVGFELLLAVAEAGVDRKLAFLEAFIKKEFPELRGRPTLGLRCDG
jgi:hypothetical protein